MVRLGGVQVGEIDSRSAEWTSKRAGERASGGQYNHSFTASKQRIAGRSSGEDRSEFGADEFM